MRAALAPLVLIALGGAAQVFLVISKTRTYGLKYSAGSCTAEVLDAYFNVDDIRKMPRQGDLTIDAGSTWRQSAWHQHRPRLAAHDTNTSKNPRVKIAVTRARISRILSPYN